jgi:7-cyano-7-deazaguanine synthase in queuosine biosynthesis
MISLLMLSGGLDSTHALQKLLKETDDEVLVHHIHLVTNFGRHLAEAESCKKIVEYCRKNFRAFAYTESAIDHRRFLAHGYDLVAAAFEAGMVAGSFKLATDRSVDRWIVGISNADLMPLRRFLSATVVCQANCLEPTAPKLFLFPRVSQQEVIDALPLELYRMTWSCRYGLREGRNFKPCGSCATCKRLANFRHPEERGQRKAKKIKPKSKKLVDG